MSQHTIQHHQVHQHYVHYSGPQQPLVHHQNIGVVPQDTQRQPQHHQQPQHQLQHQTVAQASGSGTTAVVPLVATGDWTKDLVHLAKTAELKKHALTLQLHTAHILSAHASLEQKGKAIQDVREQRNKLESERTRLLNCLREINEDRDKADLMESTLNKECDDIRNKITQLSEGDYAIAKSDVDRLRQELGQPPLPTLQSTLDEKTSQYLNERRLNGNESQSRTPEAQGSSSTMGGMKRNAPSSARGDTLEGAAKRPRGRPKGSKNRSKGDAA
ncbi:hypothetical protein K443DRAFT_679246 [Laccaria amethystina LaAM-08-1]|uniref:Uncharacterized protein n=1 Tax=Laccaria amethystina LaAM-08-1 TaxID=1095629 RepID=A0A0C9WQ70_9AGAR|nr:hypothetical protein K443DRAFT_679246 [Laccaria amethystina LaAM-08-1]